MARYNFFPFIIFENLILPFFFVPIAALLKTVFFLSPNYAKVFEWQNDEKKNPNTS
jgi:hypothetical protein